MVSRVWVGGIALGLVIGCGPGASRVRLGDTRDEVGGERACGSRSAKRIDSDHARAVRASFERRFGAARVTALALECAARASVSPEELAPAEEAGHAASTAARCEAEAQCYDGFHVTGHAEDDLGNLADRCGRACGMTPRTKLQEGTASEADLPHVYAIELDAATCYRFFAVADPGVDVLAAAITDASGNLVAIDNSRDRAPILGPRASFCPSNGGRYRLVVGVARGAGHYVVQAWSRPREPDDR